MQVFLQVAPRDVSVDAKALELIMNLFLILKRYLYYYFVYTCEWWVVHATVQLWRSENNLQGSVLSFYHMGPEIELGFSGLATHTFTC